MDLDKQEFRNFAMKDIHKWQPYSVFHNMFYYLEVLHQDEKMAFDDCILIIDMFGRKCGARVSKIFWDGKVVGCE